MRGKRDSLLRSGARRRVELVTLLSLQLRQLALEIGREVFQDPHLLIAALQGRLKPSRLALQAMIFATQQRKTLVRVGERRESSASASPPQFSFCSRLLVCRQGSHQGLGLPN